VALLKIEDFSKCTYQDSR